MASTTSRQLFYAAFAVVSAVFYSSLALYAASGKLIGYTVAHLLVGLSVIANIVWLAWVLKKTTVNRPAPQSDTDTFVIEGPKGFRWTILVDIFSVCSIIIFVAAFAIAMAFIPTNIPATTPQKVFICTAGLSCMFSVIWLLLTKKEAIKKGRHKYPFLYSAGLGKIIVFAILVTIIVCSFHRR
jgi:hypothetical protein